MTAGKSFGDFTRRNMVQGTGLSLVAALAAAPMLAEASTEASAKEGIVNGFCADWSARDVEKIIPYLAETVTFHAWEGGPVIKGVEEFRNEIGPYIAGTTEINWEILRSAVFGDVVVNERMDHILRPPGAAQGDNHFHVAGVFVVRRGKIEYWQDFVVREEA